MRVRFPGACAGAPEAVLVNTAGGIAGGDRFAVDLDLEAGARLVVTTAAAEKVYRSLGPDAAFDLTARVGDGAELMWLPQETILFDRARLAPQRRHRARARCDAGVRRGGGVRPRRHGRGR